MARWSAALAALVLSGAAQADLFDRGGGMVYDNDLNITWLADWNYAKTTGVDADGLMTWGEADAFVGSLVFGGFSDWRLPSALNADGSGPCQGPVCTGGELAHMYYNELGVTAGNSILTGDPGKLALFKNMNDGQWTNTDYNGFPVFFGYGGQGNLPSRGPIRFFDGLHAVAVRDGDVGAVPEPKTGVLILVGMGALVVAVRRRPI